MPHLIQLKFNFAACFYTGVIHTSRHNSELLKTYFLTVFWLRFFGTISGIG